jgi:hypothetical protein
MIIIVAEYPKSGGTWLVSLLGEVLELPKRDIYINNDNKLFWKDYFWYKGYEDIGLLESCVVKSHELAGSDLHNCSSKIIHLIRDGRDVVVSKYFYEKDFLVNNNIKEFNNISKEEYTAKVAMEWREYVCSWMNRDDCIICKYEELLLNTEQTLKKILKRLGYDVNEIIIKEAIINNTKEKLTDKIGELFKHNTFIRKGIVGDWKNFFGNVEKNIFKEIAGDTLIELGYEQDLNW